MLVKKILKLVTLSQFVDNVALGVRERLSIAKGCCIDLVQQGEFGMNK